MSSCNNANTGRLTTTSSLGKLPTRWGIKRLKYVATINDVVLSEKTDPEYKIEYVDIGSVTFENGIDETEIIRFKDAPSRARRLVCNGDTIISTVRTYLKAIAPIEHPPKNYVVSTGFAVVRPRRKVHSVFLGYALQSSCFVGSVMANSDGVSYPAINPSKIATLPIAIPTTKEQQTIASFLDHKTALIDQYISNKKKQINLLEKLRTSIISEAITKGLGPDVEMKDSGVEWFGKIPTGWFSGIKMSYLAIKKRASFVNGPFGSDLLTSELRKKGVPVIYIRDIKENRYVRKSDVCVTPKKAEQLSFCSVKPNDVLISKVGDPPAIACVYPRSATEAIITQDVVRIRCDNRVVDSQYLSFFLNSQAGKGLIETITIKSTRKRYTLASFKNLRIFLPPLSEQHKIVKYIQSKTKKSNYTISVIEEQTTKMQSYRTSLISEAVTGKIDVRNFSPEPLDSLLSQTE